MFQEPRVITGRKGEKVYQTKARGLAVLASRILNKGVAFDEMERKSLGLVGLLPPTVGTLEAQVKQAYLQYLTLPDPVSKNIYLSALHDRNEVLFFRLFSEHLQEMIPIVNELTVGKAMQQYHHEVRPPRGVYLSINQPEAIEDAFNNLGLLPDSVDLIVATDAEKIPGIGDWGVGGMEIPIEKLSIYTAAGGIDPGRVIPVMLDVGTNQPSLLEDPMYIGNRHNRVRGSRYDAFINSYVAAVTKLFPRAILQFEDLEAGNGRRILERYEKQVCHYNDDMQGTGAVTLAATISALRASGTSFGGLRVVIAGAGTAGIGVADLLCAAMVRDGVKPQDAIKQFWCVDRDGLLVQGMAMHGFQSTYARSQDEVRNWRQQDGGIRLEEVVQRSRANMLVGAANAGELFTEDIVRRMAEECERPIIFALSMPPVKAEAQPSDLVAWTNNGVLMATGAPFSPVTHKGITHSIAHLSNAMIFPGLMLGAIVSQASRITSGMLIAAANALSSMVTVKQTGASLLPHIDDLRVVSRTVAAAVAEEATVEGLARVHLTDIEKQVEEAMWIPEYYRIEAC